MDDIFSQMISQYNVTMKVVTLPGGTPTQLCESNPKRWGLMIGSVSGNAVWGLNSNVGLAVNGFLLPALPQFFNLRDHASLPQQEFWALEAFGTNVNVLEIIKVS